MSSTAVTDPSDTSEARRSKALTALRTAGIVVVLLLGTVVSAIGAMLIGAAADLENVQIDGTYLFRTEHSGSPLPQPDDDEAPRVLTVEVGPPESESAGGLRGVATATAELTLASDDPFARAVAQGRFRGQGQAFAVRVADIAVFIDETRTSMRWSDPTVATLGADRVRLSATAESSSVGGSHTAMRIEARRTCDRCRTTLEVTTEDWAVTGVDPARAAVRQSPESATTTLPATRDAAGPGAPPPDAVVLLDRGQAGELPEPASLPEPLTRWLVSLALAGWTLLPWWMLRRELLRDKTVAATMGSERMTSFQATSAWLLVLGLVAAAAMTTARSWELTEWITRSLASADRSVDPLVWETLYGAAAPAGLALFALWAWRGRSGPGAVRARGGAWTLWTVVVVAAVAVVVLAFDAAAATREAAILDSATLDATTPVVAIPDNGAWLAVGVGVAALGLMPWALYRSPPGGRLTGWVLATASLVLGASLSSTRSTISTVTEGVLTLGVDVAVLAMATWVAVQAADPARAEKWRARPWARWLVIGGALVVAIPPLYSGTNYLWLAVHNINDVAILLRPLLQLLLLVALVGLLVTFGDRLRSGWHLSRGVVIWAAAALMLRPEDVDAGIAWSFLAGLGLITVVLVPGRGYPLQALHPHRQHNLPAQAREFLRLATGTRLGRDLQLHARRKVVSGEIDPQQAAEVEKLVRTAIGAPGNTARKPTAADGWRWAGERSPTRRAWAGALVGTAVGALLVLATLANVVSSMEGFLGAPAWFPVLGFLVSFKFPWYGFVFGYLYPLIPGRTGLAKAVRLFVVVAVSETVSLVVPLDVASLDAATITLRLLQLALLCFALGIAADYRTLRWAGLGAARIGDVYGTYPFAVWSSGIAVAVVTTLATTMLGSAAGVLLDNILPQLPPPSPSPGP